MKITSLNIGQPRTCTWQGKEFITSIYKEPTNEPQQLSFHTLKNDTQSEKEFHGGWDKALYSYDQSYYDYWKQELERKDLEAGMFGENLTTQGMLDHEIKAGDIFEVGTCIIQAIQPRFPCARLNLRFNDSKMVKRFAQSKKHGIYYKVLQEGSLQVGNKITKKESSTLNITIEQIVNCYYNKTDNKKSIDTIVSSDLFPDSLKKDLR